MIGKTMSLDVILDRFSNDTTVHGLPRAIKAKSRPVRMFWVAALLLGVSICSAQFVALLTKYLSYPKKVTIEVVSSDVPFPSISLCNMRNLDTIILNTLNAVLKEQDPNATQMQWNETVSHPFVNAYMHFLNKYFFMFNGRHDIKTEIFQVFLLFFFKQMVELAVFR